MYDDVTASKFWSKVDRKSDGECWLWLGSSFVNNRGLRYGSHSHKGLSWRSHRFAFTLSKGEIQEGKVIRHTCDNGMCCNPRHLLSGTQKDNVWDCISRGRAVYAVGERHGKAKLNATQVRAIRARVKSGETRTSLALEYGVSRRGIRSALKGWKHVQ